MELMTYANIKQKLQNDFDISDEVFVNETELLDYCNEAIDDAETTIHTMHHEDKYFLSRGTISLTSGTASYSLPSDIYATKIRLMQYINGGDIYEIKRIKDLAGIAFISTGDNYQYLLTSTTAAGFKITFYPTVTETSTNCVIWYIRNMKRLTTSLASTNVCEIPECGNFVIQHVKRSLASKSRRTDIFEIENRKLQEQYQLMLEALKDMTSDQDNLIPLDMSSYSYQSYEGIY